MRVAVESPRNRLSFWIRGRSGFWEREALSSVAPATSRCVRLKIYHIKAMRPSIVVIWFICKTCRYEIRPGYNATVREYRHLSDINRMFVSGSPGRLLSLGFMVVPASGGVVKEFSIRGVSELFKPGLGVPKH